MFLLGFPNISRSNEHQMKTMIYVFTFIDRLFELQRLRADIDEAIPLRIHVI